MSEHPLGRLETQLVHAGEPAPRIHGAVIAPIFQSATFEFDGSGGYDDIKYVRLNNTPNHDTLHAKLACIESAEAALVTGSGMAAISGALLAVLQHGDHVLVQDSLYGGTDAFVHNVLPRWGIEATVFDPLDADSWASLLQPRTRVIYAETISNPLIEVGELDAIAAFARAHELVAMIDNTFASPINFRPAEHGYHLSLHSATKYLNGHTDLAAGAVVGEAALVDEVRHRVNLLGGMLDPHACFLLNRGMKTLALRVRAQGASAQRIAEFLEAHDAVTRVNYPGLPSSPDHERAARLLDGFGGMLSFELENGMEAADQLLSRLRIPIVAPSLGGVESLVTRPATTSHAGMSPEARVRAGVTDGLIRLSVGIEAADDLIEDLDAALS